MLFQLEALEVYFIHPLGFGLTSSTKRNIIVITLANAQSLPWFWTQESAVWTALASKSFSYNIIN